MLEKTRAVARKYGPKIGTAVATLPFAALSFAQATGGVAETATAAVDQAKTDTTTVALAILGLAVAVWAILKVVGMFGKR